MPIQWMENKVTIILILLKLGYLGRLNLFLYTYMWYKFSVFWKVFFETFVYFPIGWFVSFLSICKNFFWPMDGYCKLCILPHILWKYFPQIMVSTQFAFWHRVFQFHILKCGFISFKASALHFIYLIFGCTGSLLLCLGFL